MTYAGFITGGLALVFTIAAFWWLNAGTGKLTVTAPRAYAFGGAGERLRLRLPFGFFNTGAVARIVADMRIVHVSEPKRPELRWVTTRDRLRPESEDGFAYKVPFAVAGRGTTEVIAEFEPSAGLDWSPPSGVTHRLALQAQVHPEDEWVTLVTFDWWAPPEAKRGQYLAHRNEPNPRSDEG